MCGRLFPFVRRNRPVPYAPMFFEPPSAARSGRLRRHQGEETPPRSGLCASSVTFPKKHPHIILICLAASEHAARARAKPEIPVPAAAVLGDRWLCGDHLASEVGLVFPSNQPAEDDPVTGGKAAICEQAGPGCAVPGMGGNQPQVKSEIQ